MHSLWKWLWGKPLVGLPVIEIRHMGCQHCPHRTRGWFRWFCNLCGCTISRKRSVNNKLAHGGEECPAKRWGKV
jgi:hypothetical protein